MANVSPAGAVGVQAMRARFVENGAGTYTAVFTLPAGSTLVDVIVEAEALWAAGTSASLEIGDVSDPDRYFTAVNLKASDLLAGESINFGAAGDAAGVGVVLPDVTAATAALGRDVHVAGRWASAERTITATVVSVGAGTTGRTRVTVLYAGEGSTQITQ